MIVVYTREWNVVRIEGATSIDIAEISGSLGYIDKTINNYKELAEKYEQENVLFKERVIGRIATNFDIKSNGECYYKLGYKYVAVVDGRNYTYTFPMKDLGNKEALEKIKTKRDKINYILIDEERGIIEVD